MNSGTNDRSVRFCSCCLVAALVVALSFLADADIAGAQAPNEETSWLEVRSPSFVLYSNAELNVAAEIATDLERFRAVFARLAPAIELRSPAPTKLFAFRDAASYAAYKSRSDRPGGRILGQFSRHLDGNYLTLDAGSEMAAASQVLYHEYTHYLASINFPSVPLWFNEGLAEYYSTFEVSAVEARVGQPVERHLRWLSTTGELLLDDLLAADTSSEAYHQPSMAAGFYARSWLLMHWMLSGDQDRIDRFLYYFQLLDEGELPADAIEIAFEQRSSELESQLRDYLAAGRFASSRTRIADFARPKLSVRQMGGAEALAHLGDLQAHLGHLEAAEGLFHQALDRRPEHPPSLAGLAFVRDLQQRWPEAELLYGDAFGQAGFARTSTAIHHLHYGWHSLAAARATGTGDQQQLDARRSKAASRARRALDTAIDRKADYGQAHVLLAEAHLLPGGDHDAALRAITKARELLPSRLDLLFTHLAVLLAREDLEAAEDLLAFDIELRVDDWQRKQQARDEIDRRRLLVDAQQALDDGDLEQGISLLDEAISLTSDELVRESMETELRRLQTKMEAAQ